MRRLQTQLFSRLFSRRSIGLECLVVASIFLSACSDNGAVDASDGSQPSSQAGNANGPVGNTAQSPAGSVDPIAQTGGEQPVVQAPAPATPQVPPAGQAPSVPEIGPALPSKAAELASKTWKNDGPFDDWSALASDRYTGAVAEATINEETTGRFIDAAVLGVFRRDIANTPSYTNNGTDILTQLIGSIISTTKFAPHLPLPATGTYVCSGGGTSTFDVEEKTTVGNTQAVLLASFDDCLTFFNELDGEVALAFRSVDGEPLTMSVAFDGTRVGDAGKELIELSGTHVKRLRCEDNYRTTTNLLVSGTTGTDQVLYENYQRSSENAQALGCPKAEFVYWNSVKGTVRDSDMGSADIQTNDALKFSMQPGKFQSRYPDAFIAAQKLVNPGAIEISGSNGSKALFTQRLTGQVNYSRENLNTPLASVTVMANGVDDKHYLSSSNDLKDGLLADLADADNDQLPNSWERVHGLNPNDAADAAFDIDGDGSDALDEFSAGEDPNVSGSTNVHSIDQSISVKLGEDIDSSASTNVRVDVGIKTFALEPIPANNRYGLTLINAANENNVEWDLDRLPPNCSVAVDPLVLDCQYEYPNTDSLTAVFDSAPVFVKFTGNPTVEVVASINDNRFDRNRTDNVSNAVLQLTSVDDDNSDVTIDVATATSGESEYVTKTIAKIRQQGDTTDHDITVIARLGTNLEHSKVFLRNPGKSVSGACTVQVQEVRCEINGINKLDEYEVQLSYFLQGESEEKLDWQVLSPDTDSRRENDQAETVVNHMLSAERLQDIILSSAEGSTVVLPSGDYAGHISLYSHVTYRILGAEGAERTRLFSFAKQADGVTGMMSNLGARSTIGRMDFRSTGAPIVSASSYGENITIHDSHISPIEGVPHSMDKLFVEGKYQTSYRLLNNHIAGWGQGNGNECKSLIESTSSRGSETKRTAIFLEKNLFTDNTCDHLIVHGAIFESDLAAADLFVNNNTFNNNPSVFRVGFSKGYEDAYFVNNIIVGANNILEMKDSNLNEAGAPARVISSSNLVWNSHRTTLFAQDMIMRTEVEVQTPDLSIDPAFVDEASGDYSLVGTSGAIDAGDAPYPYYWTYIYPTQVTIYPLNHEVIEAMDGDNSGTVEFDIGAFEFKP